ncbi:hypothetical protein IV203_025354 [Nitzschia inconspicua]|uniref:Uncharacterized protein n=1 Tax=Nitzschia inconspicua TaxID=303405 RepID=A0A9K3PWT0_9STRA|nr:hypothetical protein IV203_024836 [Nitzschia inconspicua]KAG7362470.1 hypothetical protein IV203_025354 [Nitzschia inconspicua]
MDHWTFPQVIKMLEGGNAQLQTFFERHALTQSAFVQKQQEQQNQEKEVELAAVDTAILLPLSSPSNNTTTTTTGRTFSSSTSSSTSPPRTHTNGTSNSNNSNNSNATSASSVLTTDNLQVMRYKTKAALFYREQLDHHVQQLLQNESPYRGRKDRKVKQRPLGTHRSTVS